LTKERAPCSRGFEKNFSFLAGAGNHYNHEPQLDETAPQLPAVNGDGFWMEGDKFLDRKTEMNQDFYSTRSFTDRLLEYLGERTEEEQAKPFFAYLAYTAPHWPLQAPQEDINRHAGKYDDGPDVLRLRRLEALKARGLVPNDVKAAPMVGKMPKEWDSMDSMEKRHSSRRMETYAAMVDLLDQNISRVIKHLEDSDELDNTFVLFMSDNGAEGRLLEALPVMQESPFVVIQKFYNNSTENIGNFDSFVWYGPRWAAAATAPSRGFKAFTTEGGIRCPCIIRYPMLTRCKGTITHEFCTVMDILPTILELAGVSHPGSTFRGREVVQPRGSSWIPYLSSSDERAVIHAEGHNIMGWELFGRRAIRRGNWKAVYIPAPVGSDEWELFDLSRDLGETEDLAKIEPEKLQELLLEYEKYSEDTGLYDPGAKAKPPLS
jgi:arylsulfatase A-like enzyme